MDIGEEAEGQLVGQHAATQKASSLAKEQLPSSPIRLSDERGGLTFGEPTVRKAPVKVTYKNKGRSSPKKSPPHKNTFTPNPALSKRLPPSSLGSSTPSPSRPRAKPTPRGQINKKSSEKKKAVPDKDGDNESMSTLTDLEDTAVSDVSLTEPPLSQAASITTKRKITRTQSSPVASLRKKTSLKRKRSVTPAIIIDSDSDVELSVEAYKPAFLPLSSPPPAMPQGTPRNGGKRRPRAGTLPSRPGPLAATQSLSSLSTLTANTEVVHPGWDIEDHNLAFVRVDGSGALSESEDGLWWPAEVIEAFGSMRVALFGRYPGSSAKAPAKELVIATPSPDVIRPFCAAPKQLRFTETTYHPAGQVADDVKASPRKKQKTSRESRDDLDRRWLNSRDLMLKHYQRQNDGFPLSIALFVKDDDDSTEEALPYSVKPARKASPSPSVEPSEDSWEPPESSYEVPGELVLAKEKRAYTQWWPAKLMRYFPPRRRGEKAVYEVLFYDGKVQKLPDNSDMFCNEVHPNFKSCSLGQDENNYGLDAGERDEDSDLIDCTMASDDLDGEESLRESSPSPQIPAPVAFASELSIEKQFQYVKPILDAILTGQYGPAKHKHVAFMRGGKQRNAVIESAWKRGEVTVEEKEELSTCIRRWMRRRQRRQDLGVIPRDPFIKEEDGVVESDRTTRREQTTVLSDDQSDGSALTELTASRSALDDTECAASSEAGRPPPSIVSPTIQEELPAIEVIPVPDSNDAAPTEIPDPSVDVVVTAGSATALHNGNDPQSLSLTAAAVNDTASSPPGTVPTYSMLSELDQITYCTSVLLPEAILQILLWRNGLRESTELLSPEEEETLHGLGEEHAGTSYWVHEIIHMKRAAEGNLHSSASASKQPDENLLGGGRLRTRRK